MPSFSSRLRETASYFLRLGLLGFGGPLAMIAAMQKDLVESRGWITLEEFTRVFALVKAMPGTQAFQIATYLGRSRAGFLGALTAALMLVFPAFVLMVLIAIFHDSFETSPFLRVFLGGMQAGALGLILASVKPLFWNYRARSKFWSLFVFGLITTTLWPSLEPIFILSSGALSIFIAKKSVPLRANGFVPLVELGLLDRFSLLGEAGSVALAANGSWFSAFASLVWNCFKAGAFVFGSGIAIVPLMEHDFVSKLKWLSHDEFMNALAFGQITPGPIVITATFIGYRALGFIGAVSATIAIFLAPFIHMTTWFPHALGFLSRQKWVGDFLLGAIAVVIAAVLTSVIRLALLGHFGMIHYVALLATFAAVLWLKTPAWLVIPASGVMVYLASLVLS